MQLILPMTRPIVVPHYQPDFRSRLACSICRGPGISSGADSTVVELARRVRLESRADSRLNNRCCLIACFKAGDLDDISVRADGQSAWRVREQTDDLDRSPSHSRVEV